MKPPASLLSLILSAVLIPASALSSTVVFSDGAFPNASWTTSVEIINGGGTGSGTLTATGGNPGAYRRTTNTTNNAAPGVANTVYTFHKLAGATYNPSTGSIVSIDYSEASMRVSGGVQACGIAIRQGGVVYYAGGFLNPTAFNTWATTTLTGLLPTNFDALAPGVQTPDFSTSGGVIEFGFFRGNSTGVGGPGSTTVGGIDNWTVTLNIADPVSARPSTWGKVKALYRN